MTSLLRTTGGSIVSTEDDRIAAMRRREEERIAKFLNSKQRTIGIDKDALDAQLAEIHASKRMDRAEKQREMEHLQALMKHADEVEEENARAREQHIADCIAAWHAQKRKDMRREADLNDPDWLKKQEPLGAGDIGQYGPASMIRFAGDESHKPLEKELASEAFRYNQQLAAEKAAQMQAEREAEQDLWNRQTQMLENLTLSEQENAISKMSDDFEVKNYNLKLARDKRERERQERELQDRMAQEEVIRNRESDFLSEGLRGSTRFDDPNRYRRDRFKGFSQQQLEDIHAEQEAQRRAAEERRRREREEAEAEARERQRLAEAGNRLAEEEAEAREKERMDYLAFLHQQRTLERRKRQEKLAEEKADMDMTGFLDRFGRSLK